MITMSPALERVLRETTPGPNGCVIWTGALLKSGGYGQVNLDGTSRRVHRVAYELMVGPIPKGLFLDHTCHNRDTSCPGGDTCLHRRCLSPHHLEPVTPGENTRRSPHAPNRKTHCDAGHPFDSANTYYRPDTGTRQCIQCGRDRKEQRRRASGAPTRSDRWQQEKRRRRPIEEAVAGLYGTLGRRPLASEIVRLLVEVGSPFTTAGFAKKLRLELERERPGLLTATTVRDTIARQDARTRR